MSRSNSRPSALDRLEVFIGRWLTEGETVAAPGAPSARIFASDVYQWGPGGQFIMHPAYGRIGEQDVGGSRSSVTIQPPINSVPTSLSTTGT